MAAPIIVRSPMRRHGSFRPVAIALVVERDDGTLMIIGSRSIENAEVEARQDPSEIGPFLSGPYIPGRMTYRIEAECNDATLSMTSFVTQPAPPSQRGIYLPDMSFRALPAPEEAPAAAASG